MTIGIRRGFVDNSYCSERLFCARIAVLAPSAPPGMRDTAGGAPLLMGSGKLVDSLVPFCEGSPPLVHLGLRQP